MKNIVLIGASGFIGSAILREALERGHQVTGIVRHPEKDIDWVFFSPAISIHPGSRTGKFRLGKDDVILNHAGEGDISVEDYAVAMIDELEKPAHHFERFTIGY